MCLALHTLTGLSRAVANPNELPDGFRRHTLLQPGTFSHRSVESVSRRPAAREIVVVDDGSTDDTAAVARRYPNVRCIRQPNRGWLRPGTPDSGTRAGEYLVFLDADDRLRRTRSRLASASSARTLVRDGLGPLRPNRRARQAAANGAAPARRRGRLRSAAAEQLHLDPGGRDVPPLDVRAADAVQSGGGRVRRLRAVLENRPRVPDSRATPRRSPNIGCTARACRATPR